METAREAGDRVRRCGEGWHPARQGCDSFAGPTLLCKEQDWSLGARVLGGLFGDMLSVSLPCLRGEF